MYAMHIPSGLMYVTIRYTTPSPTREQPRWPCCWLLCFVACLILAWSLQVGAQELQPAATEDQIDAYQDAIEDAESESGPYAIELIDLYFGFGQVLLEDGELEEALDAFQQTAIITRVNHGPHSLEQSDYLYSVAKTESLLGNLEPAISVIEYIYQIHAREYGENSAEMLPVIDEISEWYKEEKPLQALRSRSTDFQNRSFLAARKSALTAEQYGIGSLEAAKSYQLQGQTHFRSILYMFQTGEPPIPELVINAGGSGNPWVVERSISNHFRAGRTAYENAIKSWRQNPESTSLQVAEAIAQLGDWYLVLEQFRAAAREYKLAYEVLAADGENQALADAYFGVPAPLRFLRSEGSFARNLDPPTSEQPLQVVMDVSRNGRISDIEFRNVPSGESEEDIEKVRYRLERTRFRPAVIMGELSGAERFVWVPPPVGPNLAVTDNQGPLNP